MPISGVETSGVRPPFDDASVQLSTGRGSYRRAVTIQEGERTAPLVAEARLGPAGRDALVDLTLRSLVLASTAKANEGDERPPETDDATSRDDENAREPADDARTAAAGDRPLPTTAAPAPAPEPDRPLPAPLSPRADASSSLLGSGSPERGRRVDTIV